MALEKSLQWMMKHAPNYRNVAGLAKAAAPMKHQSTGIGT
jgi:hypothetical protein